MKVTTIYKVYGCDTGGEPRLSAEFFDGKDACNYAVAQKGRIDYGLPSVRKYTYIYDPKTYSVSSDYERLEPAEIYTIASETKEEE